MCPSYRVTHDEQHLTRGRANTLRLALTGQLGEDGLMADEMYQTMDLCVSCKGCKRECPTGVDMARMKTEFLYHYRKRHGLPLRERLFAYLPRLVHRYRRLSPLINLRDNLPGMAWVSEKMLGLSAARTLPLWRRDHFKPFVEDAVVADDEKEVVLLVDTFNGCFETENATAAMAVLAAAGYHVHCPTAVDKKRPLCCGRTFFSNGLLDEARVEAQRTLEALRPYVERGVPIVGLEPSCLLTLRDEYLALIPGEETKALAGQTFMFEEFLWQEHEQGKLGLELKSLPQQQVLVHGHCHQKAFAVMSSVEKVLGLIPELEVHVVESSCCGMAGSFGYEAEHYQTSMDMARLSLLPAIEKLGEDALVVADGTSCRSQIKHGAGREALHVARILQMALEVNQKD